MERAREALKKLNVFAEMLRFRIIASRACADEPAVQVRRLRDMAVRASVDTSRGGREMPMKIWPSLRAAVASSLVASSLLLAQPAHAEKRVALVIGNNDYKNVPKLQKALKRRPDHGRHPQATRFFGDGCGEPDAAGLQPDPAGIRQSW